MNLENIISILENSKNELLAAEARNLVDWSKLSHTKEHLEFFLRHNIAVVYGASQDGNSKEVLVSSNPVYLSYLNGQRVQKNKNRMVRFASTPKFEKILRSSNRNIVRTWNLVTNKPCEISMNAPWTVQRFIGLNDKNSKAMAIATDESLERGKLVR